MESQQKFSEHCRVRVRVQGTVQGVGFRPFVHGLAQQAGLSGFVGNDGDGVFAEIEGPDAAVRQLLADLSAKCPPLAVVDSVRSHQVALTGGRGFTIVPSRPGLRREAAITADAATCAECLAEMADPADRRAGYPFTNCTNCGPRYTIVTDVPYDRANTTMAAFSMCAACRAEYRDPQNRRFHAQPVCCPDCGPALALRDPNGEIIAGPVVYAAAVRELLARVAALLRAGAIVAVKGLGGYHLAVDAANAAAVAVLRARKHREERPFAVMVTSLEQAGRLCVLRPEDRAALASPAAPIVLLATRPRARRQIAESVAPGHSTLGLLLPYTPLHHLLLTAFGDALVVTSGNISDQPIVYADAQALRALAPVADAFLTHDRPIHTRVDDSVVRAVAGGLSPVRRSRGYVPGPVSLPWHFPRAVLGCGPELKNTFCLGRDDRAVLSHHIGDLDNYETLASYLEGIEHLSRLWQVRPEVLAYDLHPDYLSTAWALEQSGVELVGVQHHHAHIASCLADNGLAGPVIGVAFDGTGYGPDGTLWGGEFLVADLVDFSRVAHFRAVPLPGGAAAIQQPWRMAASYLLAAGALEDPAAVGVRDRNRDHWDAVVDMARRGVNAPATSSVGRLFDAAAALLGVRDRVGYEGQAAIELELLAGRAGVTGQVRWPVAVTAGDPLEIQGTDLVRGLLADLGAGVAPAVVAARFHATVAAVTVEVCRRIGADRGLDTVALSGGVFQNVLLTGQCAAGLTAAGFTVLTHRRVPANDGGVSLGQAAVAGARDRRAHQR